MRQIPVLVPPPEEQAAIVRFLNWANARLERAIRAKRQVIALLTEQRQAQIHIAITQDVDAGAAHRPSGIPGFGNIPRHWEIRKIRNVATLIVSTIDKHSKPHEIPVRLCNYVDVYKNDCITEQIAFMQATAARDEVSRYRIQKGDVIITKDSETWDDIGVPSLVAYEADDLVCGYHLAILRPTPRRILGSFLQLALEERFIATQMHVRAKGVTRYGLGHPAIKDVLIPLPPLDEQGRLVEQLQSELARLARAISRLYREIELLAEYRRRLIADVVTGKFDVRQAVAGLPDEALFELPMDGELTPDGDEPDEEDAAA